MPVVAVIDAESSAVFLQFDVELRAFSRDDFGIRVLAVGEEVAFAWGSPC